MGADILFILLLALILFGPKRLPEIARQIGKFVAEFKRASNEFKYQLEAEIDKANAESTGTPAASPRLALQRGSASASAGTPAAAVPGVIPTVLSPIESSPAAPPEPSNAPPQHAEGERAADPESEHERLMRTARRAYEAQAFALRPPEPPPIARGTAPVAVEHPPASLVPEDTRTAAGPPEPVPASAPAGDSAGHGS